MAGIVLIVAVLLSAIAFVAAIWLVVVAFRQSTLWGILTLLVPFAAVIFAVKYWPESRRPFLASVATGIVSTILFFTSAGLAASAISNVPPERLLDDPALGHAMSGMTTQEQGASSPEAPSAPNAGTFSDEDEKMPVASRLPARTDPPSAGRPASSKPVYDLNAVSRDGWAPVALRDAAELIGHRVKVVTTGGRAHRGELLSADANGVTLERWLRGGSVVVDFRKSEIETLHVDVD